MNVITLGSARQDPAALLHSATKRYGLRVFTGLNRSRRKEREQ